MSVCCAAIALLVAGCDKPDPQPAAPAPSAASAASKPATSTPSAVSSAAPAASSATPAAGHAWSGDYTAKKVPIELPEKVQDLTWKRDPGDKLTGPGKLSIQVADGVVTGTASGALGEQLITGTLDGKTLSFSLLPKNAASADAMTGTGTGEVKATSITGTLRCSGPDAVAVREASFELKPAR